MSRLNCDLDRKFLIEVDAVKWQSLKFRQSVWMFLKNQISGPWTRYGNQFFFDSSQDAVIFGLYWR